MAPAVLDRLDRDRRLRCSLDCWSDRTLLLQTMGKITFTVLNIGGLPYLPAFRAISVFGDRVGSSGWREHPVGRHSRDFLFLAYQR